MTVSPAISDYDASAVAENSSYLTEATTVPDDALEYLARGYTLLPIEQDGKRPLKDLLPGGQWLELPGTVTSRDEVEGWYIAYPELNLAIIPNDDVMAVDVDFGVKPGGGAKTNGETMPPALREGLEKLLTPVVWTPSGGAHIWCRRSADLQDSRTQKAGSLTVELKAQRTYFLAPPSSLGGVGYKLHRPLADLSEFMNYGEVLHRIGELSNASSPSSPLRGKNVSSSSPYVLTSGSSEVSERRLHEWDEDLSFVLDVCDLVDIPKSRISDKSGTSRNFRCVLHKDATASATLYRTGTGAWVYKCHSDECREKAYPLALVYALSVGKVRRHPKGIQLAMWKLRLLADTGRLEPFSIHVPIPPDLTADGMTLLKGYLLLMKLRWANPDYQGTPAPFANNFAKDWTGLRVWPRFKAAWQELVDMQLVRLAGTEGRTRYWIPGEGIPRLDADLLYRLKPEHPLMEAAR